MQIVSEGPVKITKAGLESAWKRRAEGQRLVIRDSECRGLALIVNPAGWRWEFAYRPRGVDAKTQKRWPNRTITLGTPESLTVDAARVKAGQVKGELLDGRDPLEKRRTADAARQAAAAEARAKEAEAAFTFRVLVTAWRNAREGDRRESYLKEAVTCLERNLESWLDRPASSITLQEAVRTLDRIKTTKGATTANRTLAYARAAYSWALRRQMVIASPLVGVESPSREVARDRVLNCEELQAIWEASAVLSPVRRAYVRCLMLTLQRRDEVSGMRWAELSSDLTTWTLPAERSKNHKAHIVHLSDPVRRIIGSLPREADAEFVFAARFGTNCLSSFSKMKTAIDKAIAKTRPALPNWRFHDFRRSGVTALADMGFAPHVADRILNHVSGTIHGVAAVYQRAEFLAERKAALEAWTVFLSEPQREGTQGNVIYLGRG